jgi:hypothetical protein
MTRARDLFLVAGLIAAAPASDAVAAGKCFFRPVAPVTLKNMGKCTFDLEALAFSGTPAEQAKCLLNPVQPVGRLGPPLSELPAVLAGRVGGQVDLPCGLTGAGKRAQPAAGDLFRHPRHQHAELRRPAVAAQPGHRSEDQQSWAL